MIIGRNTNLFIHFLSLYQKKNKKKYTHVRLNHNLIKQEKTFVFFIVLKVDKNCFKFAYLVSIQLNFKMGIYSVCELTFLLKNFKKNLSRNKI